MKKRYLAVLAVPALLAMSSAASAQVCVLGIMLKAAIVGAQENRELTQKEAATCGLVSDEEATKAAAKKKEEEANKAARKRKKRIATKKQ